MPCADFLLIDFSAYESWCYHIWSQYVKSFSRYHKRAVSMTIDGNKHFCEIRPFFSSRKIIDNLVNRLFYWTLQKQSPGGVL